jgi:S-adenosylmethionine hydrolase
MDIGEAELDRMQNAYKAEVEAWITAIRAEEALASVNHTLAEVDTWEGAHFLAEAAGRKAEAAKAVYEEALRQRYFGI